jgi:hypothetical protein
MALTRYEQINVNNVTAGVDSIGQQTTTITLAFQTRALVQDVRDSMVASKDDRAYTKQVRFVVNFTPNTLAVSLNQYQYAINWRSKDYKILDVLESNDRMNITFVCYRNDPVTSV